MTNLAQNNGTNNLEQLTKQKSQFIDKLRGNYSTGENTTILSQIKEVEAQIKEIKVSEMINKQNAKYSRLREMAKNAWECEQPTEDITTDSGYFHKTKVKKYPKLAALKYAHANFKDGKLLELTINGERFNMYAAKYEYNKETEYTRPETFNAFLSLNSIPAETFTIEMFKDVSEKINALNTEIEKHIENYKNELEKLKVHSLNYWGLVRQENAKFYQYTPNSGY